MCNLSLPFLKSGKAHSSASWWFLYFLSSQSSVAASLPYFILGIVSILTAMVCLFLPETAGVDLPHTIEHVEKFADGLSFFYVPILHLKSAEGKKEPREGTKKVKQDE